MTFSTQDSLARPSKEHLYAVWQLTSIKYCIVDQLTENHSLSKGRIARICLSCVSDPWLVSGWHQKQNWPMPRLQQEDPPTEDRHSMKKNEGQYEAGEHRTNLRHVVH